MHDRITRAHAMAAKQHGLLTVGQAVKVGFSTSAISRLVTSGRWERLLPGVLRLWNASDGWIQVVIAGSLWSGDVGTISHEAAAAWWRFDGCHRDRVDVTLSSPRKSPHPLIRVHRLELSKGERARTGCIWVTTPARTIIDLASCVGEAELELAVHSALRMRRVTLPRLVAMVEKQRTRHGASRLRRLLDELSRFGITESPLETRFLAAIRRAGLPVPHRQYQVFDGETFVARVDFAYPEARLAIEIDGLEFHSSRDDLVRDHRRLNALQGCRWSVLFLSASDLNDFGPAIESIRGHTGQLSFARR